MNIFEQAYTDSIRDYFSSPPYMPERPTYGDANHCQPEDETVEDTALAWLWRCRVSVEEAAKVMSEIEIAEHGNAIPMFMHLLSNIGPYSDRNKITNDLEDALLETLKKCAAAHE